MYFDWIYTYVLEFLKSEVIDLRYDLKNLILRRKIGYQGRHQIGLGDGLDSQFFSISLCSPPPLPLKKSIINRQVLNIEELVVWNGFNEIVILVRIFQNHHIFQRIKRFPKTWKIAGVRGLIILGRPRPGPTRKGWPRAALKRPRDYKVGQ